LLEWPLTRCLPHPPAAGPRDAGVLYAGAHKGFREPVAAQLREPRPRLCDPLVRHFCNSVHAYGIYLPS
jgi:hypothetical protein